jgi:hypothetical protein
MTPHEVKFLDWAFLVLGLTLAFFGWRTIRKGRTTADGREYAGRAASRLGWLWVFIGILLIIAAVADVPILKGLAKLFLEAPS